MANATEAFALDGGPLNSALKAGIEDISRDEVVTFKKYVRLVLPLDGFVFWVLQTLVSESAVFNASAYNRVAYGQTPKLISGPVTLTVKGSLHWAQAAQQDETETYTINQVVFTSEEMVNDLNEIGPEEMWIADFQGMRFAFNTRAPYYLEANIHHYVGNAVYADMQTQVIDSLAGFSRSQPVVSNSLPIFLSLNGYKPPYYPDGFNNLSLRLYPSYLAPDNAVPPFATVHVEPGETRALAAAPTIDPATSSHFQLTRDLVKITTWGLRNDEVMNFVDCVNQFSFDTNLIGLLNSPVPRDEKRTQNELSTIAQKKSIELDVSYVQTSVRDRAFKQIKEAIPTFVVQ